MQCEKFAKSEQVIERLNNGEKFDAVAREMSEDKAKAGELLSFLWSPPLCTTSHTP